MSRTAASADHRILRIGYGGLPVEKGNPFSNVQTPSINLTGGIFDGLTRLNKDGSLSPWLAKSWQARNNSTWRFTLREDIFFSNGRPFDAASVASTVEYLTEPGPQTEGVRRDFSFLDGARIVDRSTVDIYTKIPVPMFPRHAAVLLIVEPKAWQDMGVKQFSLTPIGTGPLVVERWENARCVTRANLLSWRPLQIEGVDFIVIPDIASRIQAILSDGIDIAYQVAPDDFATIESVGGSIETVPAGAASSIMLQYGTDRDTPLNDIRVRQALNHAVDKNTIVDVLLGGRTVVSSQATVREAFGFDPNLKPFSYNPDLAKRLLIEAGYPDGFSMTLETSGGGTNGILVVQKVADDLARIGIEVDITIKPVMRFLVDYVRGRINADAFTLEWSAYPTLDALESTNTNSCRKTVPWYCDPGFQPVIEAAWSETNQAKGLALRHQVMRHYYEQLPTIYLHENVGFVGINSRVTGFTQTYGFIDFESVQITQ
ncbi:MAG: ABC transporter substrate-binding protein [Rhodospirillaceae bacterium]